MWFLTFVYRNLARRPLRSSLTVLAIALAIGSFVTLVGIARGFEHSFLQIYESTGIDIVVVRSGGRQRLNSSLDERLGVKIKSLPGVAEVIGGLADMVSFGEDGSCTALLQGWEPETAAFDHLRMVAGRKLAKDTPPPVMAAGALGLTGSALGSGPLSASAALVPPRKEVLLGTMLARNIDKKVGDSVELMEQERFEVVGIYETSNVFENGAMVIDLKQMQRIMDRKGMVTGFSLIMNQDKKDPAAIAETCRRVEQLTTGLHAMSMRDHVNSLTEIRLAKGMAWLTSLIALLIGTFGMMNTMVMSIHERTKEIGTLRAVGWRKGRVIRMILLEGLLLSLVGAMVGTLGSLLLLRILTRVPLVNGLIDGRLDPLFVLEGFLIAIAVGVLGCLLPARRAARLLPVVALRHE
jgi:putative ABC transport system permease protein